MVIKTKNIVMKLIISRW